MSRGNWTIVGIFTLAVAMAAFAWWHAFRRTHRAQQLWGLRAALLIQQAPQVELLRLDPAGIERHRNGRDGHELLQVGDHVVPVMRHTDISRAKGLIHARSWLVEDVNFHWDQPPPATPARWQFALRFRDHERQATLAFDVASRRVRLVETGREVLTGPMIKQLDLFLRPY